MSGRAKGLGQRIARSFTGERGRDPDSLPSGMGLVALYLATLVVAIAIPIVLNVSVSKKLSGVDQVLLGVAIYVALTLTSQAYHMRRLDANMTKERELWRVNNVFDRSLANIRESFSDLAKNRRTEPEFFSAYFERLLAIFEETIKEAASNHELLVDENHLSTADMLLACFAGRDSDVARFVHYFDDNQWMFDTWAKNYTVRLWSLVASRKLRDVRRLFIYREDSEQLSEESKKLIEFHAVNANYDYRILSDARYQNIVRDFHMRERFKDFGIYGDWYVYRTLAASPEHIEGVFSSSERKVNEFKMLFDRCWDDAPVPPPSTRGPMTPEELYGEPLPPVNAGTAPASSPHAVSPPTMSGGPQGKEDGS
jgi:hypothetical protein